MSVIYTLGDRVLIAGLLSNGQGRGMSPLYSETRVPSALRLYECVITGVANPEMSSTDTPATNAHLYCQYYDAGSDQFRTLEYSTRAAENVRSIRRLRRYFDQLNLTEVQREFIRHYYIPRPVASTGYVHMLTDLASMMQAIMDRPNLPSFQTADRNVVVAEAANMNIPFMPYPSYRTLSAVMQEPDLEINEDEEADARPTGEGSLGWTIPEPAAQTWSTSGLSTSTDGSESEYERAVRAVTALGTLPDTHHEVVEDDEDVTDTWIEEDDQDEDE